MKLEACLTGVSLIIFVLFVLSRNAYAMGATVFVATPLLLVSIVFYLRRVLSDLEEQPPR